MRKLKLNEYIIDGNVCKIKITSRTCGVLYALIDTEDVNRVKQFTWYANKDGNTYYVRSSIGRKTTGFTSSLTLHRLVASFPDSMIDHINMDGLDNRKLNLRECDYSQNRGNSRPTPNRISGNRYRGVGYVGSRNKFSANICIHGKPTFLGHYILEEDAARAYDKAAMEHFGEFATTNFKQESI